MTSSRVAQRSCRLATLPCSRQWTRAEREGKEGEKGRNEGRKEKKRREETKESRSCLLHPPPPLLFPLSALFLRTLRDSSPKRLGATLIGPSNRRVSLLPLKGAKPSVRKTARPLPLRPLVPLPSGATLPLRIRCIFQKIHECLKEGSFNICFRSLSGNESRY